jgi:ATP-dependent Lhr-like helicase
MSLSRFHPLIAEWFTSSVGIPTDVQVQSWPVIQSGADVLIAAPTGSGKTFAAFLSCIDCLFKQALARELDDHTQVLYVSPLKALSNDIQKNLQQPLAEIGNAALSVGLLMPELRVLVRTGDTPMTERQQMLKRPPHILVTTPESLYILLTAEKSRRILQTVRTVIVDEIHAVAPNKRGAHLALSLERLEALTLTKPQRIGLSATQRPIETVARFLVGNPSRLTPHASRVLVRSSTWVTSVRWIWLWKYQKTNSAPWPRTRFGPMSMIVSPSWSGNIARPWFLSIRGVLPSECRTLWRNGYGT